MARRTALIATAAAAAALAALVLVAWLAWRGWLRTPLRAAALPPPRKPTPSEKVTARLINAMDHNMRSLELGEWFLDQVVRGGGCSADVRGIVERVPLANDVTRGELRTHLADLVVALCADGSGAGFQGQVAALRAALQPDGLLSGMNGYSIKSPVPLP